MEYKILKFKNQSKWIKYLTIFVRIGVLFDNYWIIGDIDDKIQIIYSKYVSFFMECSRFAIANKRNSYLFTAF
jgi:hypothetical protein